MPDIDMDLLVANPLPDKSGYSWTLASRLGHMLRIAQERYGPRDPTYTILGYEFIDGVPRIWYPGNCGNIVIQLGLECLNDMVQACYQLAHECIHLLSPTGGSSSTVLEDGLAAYFASLYVREHLHTDIHPSMASYQVACSKVETLLNLDPYAIRNLRVQQPIISLITAELIKENYPTISAQVAASLVKKFDRDSGT